MSCSIERLVQTEGQTGQNWSQPVFFKTSVCRSSSLVQKYDWNQTEPNCKRPDHQLQLHWFRNFSVASCKVCQKMERPNKTSPNQLQPVFYLCTKVGHVCIPKTDASHINKQLQQWQTTQLPPSTSAHFPPIPQPHHPQYLSTIPGPPTTLVNHAQWPQLTPTLQEQCNTMSPTKQVTARLRRCNKLMSDVDDSQHHHCLVVFCQPRWVGSPLDGQWFGLVAVHSCPLWGQKMDLTRL